MPGRGRRVDSTASAVFKRAEQRGCVVVVVTTARLRQERGNPDGFIWHRALGWRAIEVKGPDTAVSSSQTDLAKRAPVDLVRTPEEMDDLIAGRHRPRA